MSERLDDQDANLGLLPFFIENRPFSHEIPTDEAAGQSLLLPGQAIIDEAINENYWSLDNGEKAAYLMKNGDLIRVDKFVHQALQVGAKRMDERRVAEDLEPIHSKVLNDTLAKNETTEVYQDGNISILDYDDPNFAYAPRKYAKFIAHNMDEGFNNPALIYEACGEYYKTRQFTGRYPFVDHGLRTFMENNGWSPKLQALMGAVGLHQTAIYSAKQLVRPLIESDKQLISTVKESLEPTFWESKVIGSKTREGAVYYLGYILKSRHLLKHHMIKMWGANYERNRQVFLSTGMMKIGILDKKDKPVVREQRRPIFKAIADSDYETAEQGLRELAEERPSLFGRISLDFFLRDNGPESLAASEPSF